MTPTTLSTGRSPTTGWPSCAQRLPHADLDAFDADRSVEAFPNIFTVDAIVQFVRSKTAG